MLLLCQKEKKKVQPTNFSLKHCKYSKLMWKSLNFSLECIKKEHQLKNKTVRNKNPGGISEKMLSCAGHITMLGDANAGVLELLAGRNHS